MHLKAAKLTKSSKDWQVTTITTRHEGELILSSEFVRKSIIRDEFTNKLVTLMESAELNELEKLKAAFADLLPTCFFRKRSVRRSPQAAACPALPAAAVFLPRDHGVRHPAAQRFADWQA